MSKAIKDHLINVTAINLEEFRSEAFISFASLTGRKGRFEIGVNSFGRYIVKNNGDTLIYDCPNKAIEIYHALLSK